MKKEELEKRIKGLEGLIESQRETIKELTAKKNFANDELELLKKQYNDKDKYYFNIEEDYNDTTFHLYLSEKEKEIIFYFLDYLNKEDTHFYISVLKEVYKYGE